MHNLFHGSYVRIVTGLQAVSSEVPGLENVVRESVKLLYSSSISIDVQNTPKYRYMYLLIGFVNIRYFPKKVSSKVQAEYKLSYTKIQSLYEIS